MRTLYTRTCLVCLVLTLGLPNLAFSKTSKYDRKSSEPMPIETPPPTSSGTKNHSDKVDLTDLENKYWTAKDTEFNVVQNRLYTKVKRFSVTPSYGALLSDPYTSSWNLGLTVNYYFSEREGVEVQGWKTMGNDSDVAAYFKSVYGTIADHNTPVGYIGASYNWVPVYAKLSLLEKKILYFDMAFSPGVGLTFMEAVTFANSSGVTPPAKLQAAPTFALDAYQQVFLNERLALRLDLRNHLYQETVYNAATGAERRTKVTYYGTILFGVTIFQ